MKRRLIKVPILTWTFLIVCGYNIYQIVYPDEAVCQTEKITDPNQVYVFTRLSQTVNANVMNSNLKMISQVLTLFFRRSYHSWVVNSLKDKKHLCKFLLLCH